MVRDNLENLLFGNLPGLYHENINQYKKTLTAYAVLYVENEIRQENLVNDMGAFLRFLKIAALESGQYINSTKLARDVGVAVNTLRNFYQILEDTYVGFRLNPFGRSRKRIISSPRFLIFDTGVRNILSELPLNETLLKFDAGHLFEQWVLSELYYRCVYHSAGHKISTWRTSSGAEIDAVIETPDECIPIEVKWTKSPTPRDARHLKTFIKLHSDVSNRGFIVCRTPRKIKLAENIIALPWNEF